MYTFNHTPVYGYNHAQERVRVWLYTTHILYDLYPKYVTAILRFDSRCLCWSLENPSVDWTPSSSRSIIYSSVSSMYLTTLFNLSGSLISFRGLFIRCSESDDKSNSWCFCNVKSIIAIVFLFECASDIMVKVPVYESDLLHEISMGESNTLEFKSDISSDHKRFLKSVVAFANTRGGRLIFGVRDDGTIIGIPDESIHITRDAITDSIYKSCEPPIIPDISICTLQGKNVLIVEVYPMDLVPYHLKSEGVEHGTYIRAGGTSVPADRFTLKSLRLRGSGQSFDKIELPSFDIDESIVNDLCNRLSKYNVPITPMKLENMGVVKRYGERYVATNGFALLTKNPFPYASVNCVRFRGDKNIFIEDSLDLEGDIISQVEGALGFVMKHMNLRSNIDGLVRQDTYEIPQAAIREAITNAVLHREYSMEGRSIFVRIFDDHIEVDSPGIPLGLDLNDVAAGRSKIRNESIASVFKAIGFIEKYGTGICRMLELCDEYGVKAPEFIEYKDNLIVKFFRPTYSANDSGNSEIEHTISGLEPLDQKIVMVMYQNPEISIKDLSEHIGISYRTGQRHVSKLRESGFIERVGTRKSQKWDIRIDLN